MGVVLDTNGIVSAWPIHGLPHALYLDPKARLLATRLDGRRGRAGHQRPA